MDALAGPYLASAALLVAAGGAKLRDPQPLVRALRSVGLPAPRPLVRVAALVEIALGLAAVVVGGALVAVGVAASYAAFTGFVVVALRRGGVLASCGCFGQADTPPTRTHVVLTAAFAAVAAAVAVRPLGGLGTVLQTSPALPLLVTTAAVAGTAYLVLALLPLLKARAA